ncbi:ATP-binding protein [Sphingomonas oleivorans]|nr:ATP-binding protein [Sphingomonas oleivorans]
MNYGRILRALRNLFGWRRTPRFAGGISPAPALSRLAPAPYALPARPAASSAGGTADAAQAAVPPARLRSLVLAMFNPAQPVEDRSQLLGRSIELTQLMGAMLNMRMHALVYGARGAGKTSLVRAFGDHADQRGHIVLYFSCGGDSSFAAIFAPYLADLPDSCFLPEERQEVRELIAALPPDFGARALAAILGRVSQRDVILVVDEFDRVLDGAARTEIAALVKLLSDLRARVQLLFVGIARDVGELIDAHPSLRRHLVAVPLRRFDMSSVTDLFERGARRTGLHFSPDAQATIATLAAGSPYHLRLFCFCAAMAAIDGQTSSIGREETEAGLRFAFDMWTSTNGTVAALFTRLAAQGPEMRHYLEDLARLSLSGDSLMPPNIAAEPGEGDEENDVPPRVRAFASLRPALIPSGDGTTYVFEDSLAPQLLLVACHLAALPPRVEPLMTAHQAAG